MLQLAIATDILSISNIFSQIFFLKTKNNITIISNVLFEFTLNTIHIFHIALLNAQAKETRENNWREDNNRYRCLMLQHYRDL